MPTKISPRALYPDLAEAGDDEQTQRIVEGLHDLHTTHLAPARLRASIERAVAQRAAERQQARRFSMPDWINFRPFLVLAMVFTLLLGGVWIKQSQAQGLSAEQILTRASAALSDASRRSHTSFYGVKEWTNQGVVTERDELWYQAPDKLRIIRHLPISEERTIQQALAADGADGWHWDLEDKQLQVSMVDSVSVFSWLQIELVDADLTVARGIPELSLQGFSPGAALLRDFEVTLLQDESILGRRAHVLEFQPRPGREQRIAETYGAFPRRVWLDQELYLTLRVQYLERDGTERGVSRFTTLKLNPDFAGVSFGPPAGALVTDISILEKDAQWRRAAATQDFTVFRPAFRPNHFVAFRVDNVPRGYVQSRYGSWPEGRTLSESSMYGAEITLTQRSDARGRPLADHDGETIFVGGYTGKYIYRATRDSGRHELTFERDGTRIILGADEHFDKVELLLIAESLEPVTP